LILKNEYNNAYQERSQDQNRERKKEKVISRKASLKVREIADG